MYTQIWVIIGPGDDFLPVQHNGIAMNNHDILLIRPLETDLTEILMPIWNISLKTLPAKWDPFYSDHIV